MFSIPSLKNLNSVQKVSSSNPNVWENRKTFSGWYFVVLKSTTALTLNPLNCQRDSEGQMIECQEVLPVLAWINEKIAAKVTRVHISLY